MQLTLAKVIGHRGLALLAPENTLAGIRKAHQQQLNWVEVDVMLSKDAIPLLMHDHTLDRTTNSSGKVSENNWQDLSQLDAGSWYSNTYKNETIPTLENSLRLCQNLKMNVNLELKPNDTNYQQLLNATLLQIKPFLQNDISIIVSSFCKKTLKLCHKQMPELALGYLVDDTDPGESIIKFAKEINCYSVHLPAARVSPALTLQLHKLNKKVLAFTVNKPKEARLLFAAGVDGIFSDLPLGH